MHIRIITGHAVNSKLYVTALCCHKCNHDTWDWEESMPPLPGYEGIVDAIAVCYCHECKEKLLVDEHKFLLEACNERAGWFSKRKITR